MSVARKAFGYCVVLFVWVAAGLLAWLTHHRIALIVMASNAVFVGFIAWFRWWWWRDAKSP
jgi:hypothetical protein